MTADDTLLRQLFDAAVTAALPGPAVADLVKTGRLMPPKGKTVVVGAGKGSAAMAHALEQIWPAPLSGLVVVSKGHENTTGRIRLVAGSHPLPDARGVELSQELLDSVSNLTPDDLVIALLSGGASAMLPAPPAGLTLDDELAINRALLRSGAPISHMNAIRKQFSRIKGGRLALAAAPARVVTLVLSDIPGDIPALVGSGPTLPDTTTRAEARDLVQRWKITLPASAQALLRTEAHLPPDPLSPAFAANAVHLVGSANISLRTAAQAARAKGLPAVILSDAIEGEAAQIGQQHAELVRRIIDGKEPLTPPVVLLSGGETTVTIQGACGRGGRNMEYLLALASGIEGLKTVSAIACDTDGIDGTEPDAGALANGDSLDRMRAAGIDPAAALAGHDSWRAFHAINALVTTGATGTNVNDFRAILIRKNSTP